MKASHEAATDDTNTTFSRTVDALDTYFKCEPNTPYERHTFPQMTQKDGESVHQFASRLRMQAKHCSFQDQGDQLLYQLIEHIGNAWLRRKLLETDNIKLADVLKTTVFGSRSISKPKTCSTRCRRRPQTSARTVVDRNTMHALNVSCTL